MKELTDQYAPIQSIDITQVYQYYSDGLLVKA